MLRAYRKLGEAKVSTDITAWSGLDPQLGPFAQAVPLINQTQVAKHSPEEWLRLLKQALKEGPRVSKRRSTSVDSDEINQHSP